MPVFTLGSLRYMQQQSHYIHGADLPDDDTGSQCVSNSSLFANMLYARWASNITCQNKLVMMFFNSQLNLYSCMLLPKRMVTISTAFKVMIIYKTSVFCHDARLQSQAYMPPISLWVCNNFLNVNQFIYFFKEYTTIGSQKLSN